MRHRVYHLPVVRALLLGLSLMACRRIGQGHLAIAGIDVPPFNHIEAVAIGDLVAVNKYQVGGLRRFDTL